MTNFSIKDTEIQELIQLSKLQGGSKHRQGDIYKALDRVIARGPLPEDSAKKNMPDMPEMIIICPYCFAENIFERIQVVLPCTKCGKGVFRSIKE